MSISEYIYTVLLRPQPLRRMANALIRFLLPKTVRVGNATVAINPLDPVVSGALTLRVYERDEINFFRKHYKAGMTFVDVGANVGLYTALALAAGENNGHILCIEPHAESRFFLEKTIKLNSPNCNISIAPVAAGASSGQLMLHSNPENKGDNRIYSDNLLTTATSVEVSTIDELCTRNRISTVEFMKMDIQGAEFQALQGASKILSHSTDCILMTEFWAYGISHSGARPQDYLELIRLLGFTAFNLQGDSLTAVHDSQLLSETSGRAYRNIVALKGKHLSIAKSGFLPFF